MFLLLYAVVTPLLCGLVAAALSGRNVFPLMMLVVLSGFALALALVISGDPSPMIIPRSDAAASPAKTPEEMRSFRLRFAVAAALLAITLPSGFTLFSKDARLYVFSMLGFRAAEVSLSLSPSNLARVRSAAEAAGIVLSVCRSSDGSAIIAPVDVLWHGVGARSMVALARRQAADKPVELELAAEGVQIIRNSKERCIDVAEAALFESGSPGYDGGEAPDRARARLEALLQPHLDALKGKWYVRQLLIIGHADPMPLPNSGNAALAQKRAEAVKRLLCVSDIFRSFLTAPGAIEARSAGAREPLRECDVSTSRDVQRECNEVNRRVEIRLRVVEAPGTKERASVEPAVSSGSC